MMVIACRISDGGCWHTPCLEGSRARAQEAEEMGAVDSTHLALLSFVI